MGPPPENIFYAKYMEDIEQIRERIVELADRVYNLTGKVDDREISKMMSEIIYLNEFEVAPTGRRRGKRRRWKRN